MKIPWTTILFIAVAILVTLQLKSCFDTTNLPEEMIRNQERLKYLEEKRLTDSVSLVETRGKYDSLISVSSQKSSQLANKYQATKKVYDKIPVIISNYDREQLRNAVTNY